MDWVVLELPTGHLAYSLIAKMIDRSPNRRPSITEICETLGVRSIRIRRISILIDSI
jgi:hypothetical protein